MHTSVKMAAELLRLSTFDGFTSIGDDEEYWDRRSVGRRSPSPVGFITEIKTIKPKRRNPETDIVVRKQHVRKQKPYKNKKHRHIQHVQNFIVPAVLSKHKPSTSSSSYFPFRVPNALCSSKRTTLERANAVPKYVLERENSHNRTLMDIYARRLQHDTRAKSRRNILDAARKSRQRYILDTRGFITTTKLEKKKKKSRLIVRQNRPRSVYRFRPRGFDWSTARATKTATTTMTL